MKKTKRSLLLMLILGIAFIVAACSGGTTGSGDGAEEGSGEKDEGSGKSVTVDVYTHNESEEMQDFVKGLKEETGIDVNVLRMSSGEGWSRVESEAPNFGADMYWGMMHSLALKAEREDYLEPYMSPEWEDVPDHFKHPEGEWYGWSYWFNILGINEDLLEEKGLDAPKSWEDLLDPQYKGEIVLPDPGSSGTGYLFVSAIMQILGEDEGWEYLEKFHENVGQYTQSGDAPGQMVAQGEYAVGITWDQAVFSRMEEGYPITPVFPEEGVGYDLDVIWMFKDTENRETVEKIIDYIGSEQGMLKSAEHRSMVTKPGIEGTVENVEQYLIDYDAEWAEENRDRLMEEFRNRFSE